MPRGGSSDAVRCFLAAFCGAASVFGTIATSFGGNVGEASITAGISARAATLEGACGVDVVPASLAAVLLGWTSVTGCDPFMAVADAGA